MRPPAPASRDLPDPEGRSSGAVGAVTAVARLFAAGQSGPARVREILTDEARGLLGATRAQLCPAGDPVLPVLEGRTGTIVRGAAATALDAGAGSALVLPLTQNVLVLADPAPDAFGDESLALGEALAAAATAALARGDAAERQAALTRAAATLHESLDLPTVLANLCLESTRILDGDCTGVYRGTTEGIVLEAAHGLPPELVGFRLKPGEGLSGKVLSSQESMLTNDYRADPKLPGDSPFRRVRSAVAVPMRWGGELHGVLTVGYMRPFEVTPEHLALLETFAELASIACANADTHAGLALAARTDGLTGCLNHAAMHESLRREIERAERAVAPALSLVMLDLDDFKSVNEVHGHLVGDEVLRRAGHALRQATRPYDIAARYGGDEFALIAVEAGEAEAEEIARRTIERISAGIGDLCEGGGGQATAGVAEWQPGLSPTELVARADRALLFGKHESGRGRTVPFSSLPDWFRPGRFTRRGPATEPAAGRVLAPESAWSAAVRPAEERLRERARRLAWANGLGARLTRTETPDAILELAARALGEMLEAAAVTVLRLGEGGGLEQAAGAPLDDASLAAQVVGERRAVLVTNASVRARLAVPLQVADAPWGAIEVVAAQAGAFDEDDLQLAEAVAEHAGAALHAALRLAAARRDAGT